MTFADYQSTLAYIELLQQEVADDTFSLNPSPSPALQEIRERRQLRGTVGAG
jgi:hypothetical protein